MTYCTPPLPFTAEHRAELIRCAQSDYSSLLQAEASWVLLDAYDAARQRIAELEAALRSISTGRWYYDRDDLTDCQNVMESWQGVAADALRGGGGEGGEGGE